MTNDEFPLIFSYSKQVKGKNEREDWLSNIRQEILKNLSQSDEHQFNKPIHV
jgi:hypothetical protein